MSSGMRFFRPEIKALPAEEVYRQATQEIQQALKGAGKPLTVITKHLTIERKRLRDKLGGSFGRLLSNEPCRQHRQREASRAHSNHDSHSYTLTLARQWHDRPPFSDYKFL
jgi:hypothetical protein